MENILVGWPYLGLVAGVLGFAVLLLKPHPGGYAARFRDPAWLLWLLLPMYMLHQFEEHGVNFLGQHYAFLNELCGTLCFSSRSGCPVDEGFLFAVNPVSVWVAGQAAGLWSRRRPMVGACGFGIPLVNAIIHIRGSVVHHAYGSGVVTSLVLFLPVSAWVLWTLHRQGLLDRRRFALVVLAGGLVHALLLGALALRERGMLGPAGADVLMAGLGLLPIALGWSAGAPAPSPREAPMPAQFRPTN
jgi:hypothetical protein